MSVVLARRRRRGAPPVMFGYGAGASVTGLGGTFTRADASTCATYVDSSGVVQTAAANVIRDAHYVNGVRTVLLEGARTNGLTQTSDLSVGTTTNNCTIGADATTAPDGTATADKIQEDNTAGVEHGVSRSAILPATTPSTTQSVTVWVKSAERTWCILSTVNRDGAVWRTWFNLATGAFGTTNANHTARVLVAPSTPTGWYRLGISFDSGAGAGALQWATNAATADNTLTYNGVTGSGIYAWGRTWEADKPFPSSFIATAGSAVTRADDALSFPFLPVPQALTVYVDGYELGTLSTGTTSGIFGLPSDVAQALLCFSQSGFYRFINRTSGGDSGVTQNIAPSYGDRYELRGAISSAGAVTFGQSVNGGSENVPASGSAKAFDATWNANTLNVGTLSANVGFTALRSLRIAAGVQSLNTMRAA